MRQAAFLCYVVFDECCISSLQHSFWEAVLHSDGNDAGVIGEQVLLAIANGAWLLTPEWVTASLHAGAWLPEGPFQSQVVPDGTLPNLHNVHRQASC